MRLRGPPDLWPNRENGGKIAPKKNKSSRTAAMRALYSTLIMGLLAACSPPIPDSGVGVGFNNSDDIQRAREASLNTGQPFVPPSVLSDETTGSAPIGTPLSATALPAQSTVSAQPLPQAVSSANIPGANSGTSDDIAAETAAALAAASANSGVAPLQASPSNPSPQSNLAISDENDFSAVADRQTISSDAERIAQNRAQYQVIAPTALPTRSGSSQPNIVDFALSTSNPRGTKVYTRSGFNSSAKAARNCARFASPDQAQTSFLSKGGPQKDRQGLDPDGDGFACSWDPAPFRQAAKN
jgi:hypothetical protein